MLTDRFGEEGDYGVWRVDTRWPIVVQFDFMYYQWARKFALQESLYNLTIRGEMHRFSENCWQTLVVWLNLPTDLCGIIKRYYHPDPTAFLLRRGCRHC
jgi:hypothetical protein